MFSVAKVYSFYVLLKSVYISSLEAVAVSILCRCHSAFNQPSLAFRSSPIHGGGIRKLPLHHSTSSAQRPRSLFTHASYFLGTIRPVLISPPWPTFGSWPLSLSSPKRRPNSPPLPSSRLQSWPRRPRTATQSRDGWKPSSHGCRAPMATTRWLMPLSRQTGRLEQKVRMLTACPLSHVGVLMLTNL